MAPGATKAGSEEEWVDNPNRAQTALVSRESCHVARTVPPSSGLGLKKWVVSCLSRSLNSVACGVKSVKAKPEGEVAEGRQM